MKATVVSSKVEFSGVLNEDSPMDKTEEILRSAASALSEGARLKIDFSNVARANSCGILAWFKLAEHIDFPLAYVNAPVWLVEQFGFYTFPSSKVIVESLYAPFYCPQNDLHQIFVLKLGVDIPLLENYINFSFEHITEDGLHFEPDFEPEHYFKFIAAALPFWKDQLP